MAGLKLEDPVKAADEASKTLRAQGAACIIALVHMGEAQALAFARKVADVNLVVAGGFGGLDTPDRVPTMATACALRGASPQSPRTKSVGGASSSARSRGG